MKLLLVSNMYPSNKSPFFGTFVKEVYDSFPSDVYIKELSVIDKKVSGKFEKIFLYLKFFSSVLYKIIIFRPDYVYCHYISHSSVIPAVLKRLGFNFKLVSHVHGSDIHSSNHIIKKLNNFSLKYSDVIVVPSNSYKEMLQIQKPSGFIYVSPSGGISDYFFESEPKDRNTRNIYFVGRLEKVKRPDLFVDFYFFYLKTKERDGFKFHILGDGSLSEELKSRLMNNTENDFVFSPAVSKPGLVEVFDNANFVIIPSERESLCLVALEAMSRGCIVISHDNGGVSDFISHGNNGFIINFNDESCFPELYTIINSKNTELIDVMKNARKTAEKYRSSTVNKELIKDVFI